MKTLKNWLTVIAGLTLAIGVTTAIVKEKITYDYQMDPMYEAALWAMKNGKVSSDKVDVELTALSIPALIQATTTKQYDVIQADVINVQRSADRGLPLIIVSTANRYNPKGEGHNIWVKKDSPYKSMADLKGKKIAVPSVGSSGFNLLRFAVEDRSKVNMKPIGGDFVFVEMPVPQIEAAIAMPAKDMYEMWGLQMIPSINVTYPEKLEEKPEAIKELARMMKASADYLQANPNEVYDAVAKEQNINRDFFTALANGYAESPNVLSENDHKAIIKLWDLAYKNGLLKTEPDNEAYFWSEAY